MQAGDILSEKEADAIEADKQDAARWRELCRAMLEDDQAMLGFLDVHMPEEGRRIEHINLAMDAWMGREQ